MILFSAKDTIDLLAMSASFFLICIASAGMILFVGSGIVAAISSRRIPFALIALISLFATIILVPDKSKPHNYPPLFNLGTDPKVTGIFSVGSAAIVLMLFLSFLLGGLARVGTEEPLVSGGRRIYSYLFFVFSVVLSSGYFGYRYADYSRSYSSKYCVVAGGDGGTFNGRLLIASDQNAMFALGDKELRVMSFNAVKSINNKPCP